MANDDNLQRMEEEDYPELTDHAVDQTEGPPPHPRRKPGRLPRVPPNTGAGAGGSNPERGEQEKMVVMTRAELNALMAAEREKGRGKRPVEWV